MQGFLPFLSFAIWIAVWVLVVKKRGKLKLLAGNLIGAIVGFIVATVVLAVLAPDLTAEQKAANVKRDTSVTAPQQEDATSRGPVSAEVIDKITLLYLKHKIYAKGAIDCVPAVIGGRDMIGCWSQSLDGRSNVHVWEYAGGKFKSINGSASGVAETKFSNEGVVELSSLPLPSDIDVGAIVEFFKKI